MKFEYIFKETILKNTYLKMERIDVKKEVIETNDPGGTCQELSQSN
jgi:hypothetical protein